MPLPLLAREGNNVISLKFLKLKEKGIMHHYSDLPINLNIERSSRVAAINYCIKLILEQLLLYGNEAVNFVVKKKSRNALSKKSYPTALLFLCLDF